MLTALAGGRGHFCRLPRRCTHSGSWKGSLAGKISQVEALSSVCLSVSITVARSTGLSSDADEGCGRSEAGAREADEATREPHDGQGGPMALRLEVRPQQQMREPFTEQPLRARCADDRHVLCGKYHLSSLFTVVYSKLYAGHCRTGTRPKPY